MTPAEERIIEAVLHYYGPHATRDHLVYLESDFLSELRQLARDCEMERMAAICNKHSEWEELRETIRESLREARGPR